jgi:hypothetical protein
MGLNRRRAIRLVLGGAGAAALGLGVRAVWDEVAEKRVAVLVPGRLVRGAWQRPWPLRRLIARERIRTIVTLTAINCDDPKYVSQAAVVRDMGVAWVIVPMRGSQATLEQMAESADLVADPRRQPVFFHCVAGHHRSSLVHAAYLIRHRGYTAADAWRVVAALPWARPDRDAGDRRLIEAFALLEDLDHARRPAADSKLGPAALPGPAAGRRRVRRLEPGDGQLCDRPGGPGLPLGPDARSRSRGEAA